MGVVDIITIIQWQLWMENDMPQNQHVRIEEPNIYILNGITNVFINY